VPKVACDGCTRDGCEPLEALIYCSNAAAIQARAHHAAASKRRWDSEHMKLRVLLRLSRSTRERMRWRPTVPDFFFG